MTKKLLPLLFALLCFSLIKAQTNVSGMISSNTNWTLAGSPYIITGNTILDSGFVLTIDPGVDVKFNTGTSIVVRGNLRAIGTAANRIRFTSNQANPAPGNWDYILIDDDAQDYDHAMQTGSILEHCLVEYAGGSSILAYNGAIRINSSFPFIHNCEIANNSTTGVRFYGDPNGFTTPDVIKIVGCYIHHNSSVGNPNPAAGGIDAVVNQAALIVDSNTVMNNTGATYGGGMTCNANNANSRIYYNRIINNSAPIWGGGINCTSINNVSYNLIYGNSSSNGGGIYRTNGYVGEYMQHNIFAKNTSTVSDILFLYNSMTLRYNTFADNLSAANILYFNTGATHNFDYNTFARNRQTAVNGKMIYVDGSTGTLKNNNISNNMYTYSLYNNNGNGAPDFHTDNTWWNTTSSSGIDSQIFDYFDNNGYGIVDYTPFATSPDTVAPVIPVMQVIKTDLGGGNIEVSWNANSEGDLAGYRIYTGGPGGYAYGSMTDVGNVTTYTLTGASLSDSIAVTAYDSLADGMNDQLDGNESWYTRAIGIAEPYFNATSFVICAGTSVSYVLTTSDVVDSVKWTFAGGMPAVSMAQNPGVSYAAGGTYAATVVTYNIAGTDTASQMITVNAADTSLTLSSITLTANAAGAGYAWADCNAGYALIPSETSQSFMATANGSYALVITQNGCTDTSGCFMINEVALKEHASSSAIAVYPNPAGNAVHFRFDTSAGSVTDAGEGSIVICDVLGKTVCTSRSLLSGTVSIDMSGLQQGLYHYRIMSGGKLLHTGTISK